MKRKLDAVDGQDVPQAPSLLERIRSSWEFANLMQYVFIFGKAVKIDEDLDIEDLETECIKPTPSEKLSEIGLCLLKFVSSHRGLTHDIFDEYTRRQYLAKAPSRNPFGEAEEPLKFADFDIFTKLKVLHQLSVWTFWNPDRLRERMGEKDAEQTQWRIEPFGWDREDRTYFLLDDDRLYRQTEPPPPQAPSSLPTRKALKSKPKPKTKGKRSSKRQMMANGAANHTEDEIEDEQETTNVEEEVTSEDNGLGGAKWECLAITKEDYTNLLDSFHRTRDPNEKALVQRIGAEVMPIIDKKAEAQERKAAKHRRELENLQRMASAKRSSRIADKAEKQKELDQAAEAERKRQAELEMVAKEQEKQRKLEDARESRMLTREQRLKEREVKRILHEQELERLKAEHEAAEADDGLAARVLERHTKSEVEKKQRELEQLNEDEEEWYFDCSVCGVHGKNLDDGTHSLACETCGVWQHSNCHGIKEEEAEREDFHFFCASCSKPKISLKLHMTSSSPPATKNGNPAKKRGRPRKSDESTDATPSKKQKVKANGIPNGVQQQAQSLPQPSAFPHVAVAGPSHSQQLQNESSSATQPLYQANSPHDDRKPPPPSGHFPTLPRPSPIFTPASHHPTPFANTYVQHMASPPGQKPPITWSTPNNWNHSSASTYNSQPRPYGTSGSPIHQRPPFAHGQQPQTTRPLPSPSVPLLPAPQSNKPVQYASTSPFGYQNSHSYMSASSQPSAPAYSPTKHQLSPPAPGQNAARPPVGNFSTTPQNSYPLPKYEPAWHAHTTPSTLPPAPTLSPSIGANQQNLPPPVKKPTPEKPLEAAAHSSPKLIDDSIGQHSRTPEKNTQYMTAAPTLQANAAPYGDKVVSPVKKPTPEKSPTSFGLGTEPSPKLNFQSAESMVDTAVDAAAPTPTLTPTVNAGQQNFEPPLKRVALDFVSHNAPTTNGVNGHSHG